MDAGQPPASWKCYVCGVFVALTLKVLMSHYFSAHSKELNFFVKCGVNDCPATFRRYHSFYKHVARNHKDEYKGNIESRNDIHENIIHDVNEDLIFNVGPDTDECDLDRNESTSSEGTISDSSCGSSDQEYDAFNVNSEVSNFHIKKASQL